MNRRRALSASLSAVCFAFAFALLGCQKSADQPSSASSPDAAAPGSDSSAPASAANQPTPPPPPPPRPIVIPADTVISVVLDQAVGSKISTPGQAFSATVQSPVEVDGRIAITQGARAS